AALATRTSRTSCATGTPSASRASDAAASRPSRRSSGSPGAANAAAVRPSPGSSPGLSPPPSQSPSRAAKSSTTPSASSRRAAKHPHPVGAPGRVPEERRLADARLAPDDQDAAALLTGPGEQPVEQRALPRPAVEHGPMVRAIRTTGDYADATDTDGRHGS